MAGPLDLPPCGSGRQGRGDPWLPGHCGQIRPGPGDAFDPKLAGWSPQQLHDSHPNSRIAEPLVAGCFAPGQGGDAVLGEAMKDLTDLAVGATHRRHDLGDLLSLGREQDDASVPMGRRIGRAEQSLHLAPFFGGEGTNVDVHCNRVLHRLFTELTSGSVR
jgi:hypothetical protein